jgi:hypothetical protein
LSSPITTYSLVFADDNQETPQDNDQGVVANDDKDTPQDKAQELSATDTKKSEGVTFSMPNNTQDENSNTDTNEGNDTNDDTYGEGAPSLLNKQRSKRRTGLTSAELRKDVPAELSAYNFQDTLSDDLRSTITSASQLKALSENERGCWGWFVKLFLNERYPLRRQMLLSFGTTAASTILLVMCVAIVATVLTGEAIKKESTENMDAWVDEFMGSTSRMVAEAISPKIMVRAFHVCVIGFGLST